jgi:hypothetical protein
MTPEEQGRLIEEVEHDIERLNALYNQYFMGIEKIEPVVHSKNLERKLQLLHKEQIRNTALRFRFQMLVQKLNTQSNYWRRICRQIEEGTYIRHVARAQQRSGRASIVPQRIEEPHSGQGERLTLEDLELDALLGDDKPSSKSGPPSLSPASPLADLDDPFDSLTGPEPRGYGSEGGGASQGGIRNLLDLDDPLEDAPPDQGPPLPRRSPRAPVEKPLAPKPNGFDEEAAKQIYKTYLAARRKTNEPVDGLSFEKMRATLERQHKAKGGKVDFKVVIRDGRAVIKAVNKN